MPRFRAFTKSSQQRWYLSGSSQVPIPKHSFTFVANVTNNVFLSWSFVDNHYVGFQQKKTIFLCNFTCLIMENVPLCAFHRKMANCEKPHSWTWRNYLPWISICLTVSRIGSTSSYGRLRNWLLLSFSHSKLKKGILWSVLNIFIFQTCTLWGPQMSVLECRQFWRKLFDFICCKPQKYFTKQKMIKHWSSIQQYIPPR